MGGRLGRLSPAERGGARCLEEMLLRAKGHPLRDSQHHPGLGNGLFKFGTVQTNSHHQALHENHNRNENHLFLWFYTYLKGQPLLSGSEAPISQLKEGNTSVN